MISFSWERGMLIIRRCSQGISVSHFHAHQNTTATHDMVSLCCVAATRAHADDEFPELLEGINTEEARMLEAAMFGTAYTGRIPDFSNPVSDLPTDPGLLEQRLLRNDQDAAYHESLKVCQPYAPYALSLLPILSAFCASQS